MSSTLMRNLIVAISMLGLTACDTVNGVSRDAEIDSVPEMDCVRNVVTSTPGIVNTKYEKNEGGTAITLSGLKPEGTWHDFFYVGTRESQILGVLQIHKDVRGYISFHQANEEMNAVPSQKSIDASRPIMRQIEIELSKKCGLPELPARITERCQRVKCGPLS